MIEVQYLIKPNNLLYATVPITMVIVVKDIIRHGKITSRTPMAFHLSSID